MFFILQKEDDNTLDMEFHIISEKLRNLRRIHEFTIEPYKNFFQDKNTLLTKESFLPCYQNAIPIGTIDFVNAWLKIFHNVDNQNPIEIPPILQTEEFLKREYKIVTSDKLPRSGAYFIKDVSKLKSFSSVSYDTIDMLPLDDILKSPEEIQTIKNDRPCDTSLYLDNTHLYQVSERLNVLSEYRVYVIDGKIENISNYNGDPLILPDTNLINKAVMLYSYQKDSPKSFTIDIMVTNRGTSIIEIHNWASIGLYNTLWGDNLLYAYRDGIDYTLSKNIAIKTTE